MTSKREMDFLFRRVAAYRGVVLSGYILSLLLAAAFLGLLLTDYKTPSPLYLLFLFSVLPYLLRTLMEQKKQRAAQASVKKEETNASLFPLFCKKYKFSSLRLNAANLSYLIIFFCLLHGDFPMYGVQTVLRSFAVFRFSLPLSAYAHGS